jgi:HPt (histidine-containing phosphotransfer) domain-containing protein
LFDTVARYYRKGPSGVVETPVPAEPSRAAESGDEIPAIEGLDAKDGETRVMGNRKLYVKLLRQFVEQQGSALEEIAAAVAKGETPLAERLAHTLKGVAGSIGAKAVQAAAATLETMLREGAAAADVETARQRAILVLDPLVVALRSSLPAPSAVLEVRGLRRGESNAPAGSASGAAVVRVREADSGVRIGRGAGVAGVGSGIEEGIEKSAIARSASHDGDGDRGHRSSNTLAEVLGIAARYERLDQLETMWTVTAAFFGAAKRGAHMCVSIRHWLHGTC